MLTATSGCGTLSYLLQGAGGQLELFDRARPIAQVLRDESAAPKLKYLLAQVEPIKAWGAHRGLDISDNYRDYVPLNREAAVWVVTASERLAFEPKTWSFPLFGSFPYLGFFAREDAVALAAELQAEGWDAYVRPAAAYSTLGWFSDPILSTMLSRGDDVLGGLVNVVLHESVHATHYVAEQGPFSESIALFIGRGMTPQYLTQVYGARSPMLRAYRQHRADRDNVDERMEIAFLALQTIYTTDAPDAEKLKQKAAIFRALGTALDADETFNNATLIDFKTYRAGTEELQRLFEHCQGDWRRFIGALTTVDQEAFSEEQQENLAPIIEPLIEAGCL
ncbi:MAG: aminopeptidase [Myxococcota bacterium]